MRHYELESTVERTETDVLVVHCSDHRFQAGLRQFLDQALGLKANYDMLAVPGGPQCLADVAHLPKFAWVSRKWFRFLVEAHSLKRAILIAHQDCGWYKRLAEYEAGGASGGGRPDQRQRQEHDLRLVRDALRSDFPKLNVELYYAGWDAADRVRIEATAE
jgi:hypothetical protein